MDFKLDMRDDALRTLIVAAGVISAVLSAMKGQA